MKSKFIQIDDNNQKNINNSGAYIITYYLSINKEIEIGKLGEVEFIQGYYYYVGSAMKNLTQRVKRHLSKDKKLRWHVDYFSIKADPKNYILIHSNKKIECEISKYVINYPNILYSIKKFGSSDCSCESHLFYSELEIHFDIEDIYKSII